jgi:hypothetical protein
MVKTIAELDLGRFFDTLGKAAAIARSLLFG